MTFTQETFLGASIRSFDGNIGWRDTSSTVTVRLVVDDKNGDSFIIPEIAKPYTFNYQSWEFIGIVQKWEQVGSSAGNPLYEVVLEDARNVLSGAQIIKEGYTGSTFNVPNLFNVFGYLETVNGFGSAGVTSAGIPWKNVRDALVELSRGDNPTFGSAISQSGYEYELDLTQLPELPDFYRVSTSDSSILNFIGEICDAANHEFYFVNKIVNNINVIKVITINRNIAPKFGAITDFVTSTVGATSKRSGVEFRNEDTSKFLVGGNQIGMYLQGLSGGSDDDGTYEIPTDLITDPEQNGIWYYWGKDYNGNVIVGDGLGTTPIPNEINYTDAEHTFELMAYWIDVWPSDRYASSVNEMRAAEEGEAAWETYISLYNNNYYIEEGIFLTTDPDTELARDVYRKRDKILKPAVLEQNLLNAYYVDIDGQIVDGTTLNDNGTLFDILEQEPKYAPVLARFQVDAQGNKYTVGVPLPQDKLGIELFPVYILYHYHREKKKKNPHFGKADILGIGGRVPSDIPIFLSGKATPELENLTARSVAALTKKTVGKNTQSGRKGKTDATQSSLMYGYVKEFAEEYYGKKFMVRIPFVSVARDQETNELQTSREPRSSGFLDESVWEDAISNNVLPQDVNRVSEVDGRIKAYVKIENDIGTDLEDSADDIYDLSEIDEKDIIKNEVEQKTSANKQTNFILISLEDEIVYLDRQTFFSPRVIIELPGAVRSNEKDKSRDFGGSVVTFLDLKLKNRGFDKTNRERILAKIGAGIGSDNLRAATAGLAILPHTAVIPLLSNISTYGPWYASGANGKLNFEQDESLVPWNHGGFVSMNNVAQAKVDSSISQFQESETGSVNFPGVPAINLGAQLSAGGPHITSINVNIGEGGASTTYNMSTWSPQPYKMRKSFADAQSRMAQTAQKIRRDYRQKIRNDKQIATVAKKKAKFKQTTSTKKPGSSAMFLSGQSTPVKSGYMDTTVVIQTHDLLSSQLGEEYQNKAACSLDTIFHPFATDSDNAPSGWPSFRTGAGEIPTVNELNPFSLSNSYGMVLHGTGIHTNNLISDESRTIDNARSLAFRLPAVFTGPAYTTSGTPFPDDGNGNWPSGVNANPNTWPCGPIDLRWDNTRGVFVGGDAGGTISGNDKIVRLFQIKSGPFTPGRLTYTADSMTVAIGSGDGATVVLGVNETGVLVGNFRTNALSSGGLYMGYNVQGNWIVDNQSSFLEFI